jgi:RNA polymerase sporulation-specific sigma factor
MNREDLAIRGQNGDRAAIDELFADYKGYLRRKASGYYLAGHTFDDVVQIASIGLYDAVLTFKPEKGVKFNTFAIMCMESRLKSAVTESCTLKNSVLNNGLSLLREISEDGEDTFMDVLQDTAPFMPDELVVDKLTCEDIMRKIKKLLSSLEFDIMSLHIKGRSARQISKDLGKSYKLIDNAMQRSRRKLKEKLVLEENE